MDYTGDTVAPGKTHTDTHTVWTIEVKISCLWGFLFFFCLPVFVSLHAFAHANAEWNYHRVAPILEALSLTWWIVLTG